MPYALIPDGFELKKVTKAEKDAVDEYFGRERKGSYIEGFLSNENTPLLIGASALALSLPVLIPALLQAQEDALNITLTDTQKADLLNYAQVSLGPIGIAGIVGRKIGKGLVDIDISDLEKRLRGFEFGGLA